MKEIVEKEQQTRKERILKKRAEHLARRPPEEETGEMLDVVEFRIGIERYAIESIHVREVFPLRDLTPVPGTPDFVLGIINVRGQILSVVDLRAFFEMSGEGLQDTDCVIILCSAEMEFGVLATAVDGARHLAKAAIRPALPTMTDVREEFILGITGAQCVVIDGSAILENEKMKVE
jgi:purine-binding chemotaxis protein CheW